MADCFFDNTAPGCPGAPVEEVVEVVEPAPVAEPTEMDGDMDMDMKMEDDMMMEMDDGMKKELRDANLAFLMMAGSATTWAVIDLFFWKWQITYSNGEEAHFASEYAAIAASSDISTGWWRLGSLIGDWSALVIMGSAFLTQLLSMFGVAAAVNMMVWGWGVMLGGGIVSMLCMVFGLLAYMQAMSLWVSDSDTNSATTQGSDGDLAEAYASAIQWDMLKMMAHETAATLAAWEYGESWMKAQFMALSPEEQMMWKEKHGEMDSSDMEGKHGDDHEGEMSGMTAPEDETAEEAESAEEEPAADAGFDDFFGLFRKNVFRF